MPSPSNTDPRFSVRFEPSGTVQHSSDSLTLLEIARLADVAVYNTCNGVGVCGKCLVRVSGPVSEVTRTERRLLKPEQIEEGWRLACEARPLGPVTVEVPHSAPRQIVTGGVRTKFRLRPNLTKRPFRLPEPHLEDQLGDYERACRELGLKPDPALPLDVLKSLSHALRPEWSGTAIIDEGRLVGVEPGDTTAAFYGVAFDIGTTTIAGYLHNLWNGEELGVVSGLNPQAAYGADVISRIQMAVEQDNGLRVLHTEVCNGINRMVRDLAAEAGVEKTAILCASIAGNSVMQHLFLGIDPRNIAFAPYIPIVQTGLKLSPRAARLDINPAGSVFVMPAIASYVGGDIVADILATRLWRRRGNTLLVDIGTNGEIVLARNGEIHACAAAAGPCFEGASISSGMRAAAGAISEVRLSGGDFAVETVAGAPPVGFCGSGLIDAVAALLDGGLVDETGRLFPPDEIPSSVPAALAERVRVGPDGKVEVALASGPSGDVTLTQGDIRELQNAKGSIAAGVEVLCRREGIRSSDLDRVLLAGAFGSYLRPSSARRIGLLPQLPLDRISSVGNAAGSGARMALLSSVERRRALDLKTRVRYTELSGAEDFRDAYMDAMFFPE